MRLNLLFEAAEGHTCRFPPKGPDDEAQMRRNRRTCKLCDEMYEAALDAELGVMPTGQEVERPGEVEARPGETFKQKRVSKPGPFGTGRPAPIQPGDSPLVQLLKTVRDTGGEEWSRRGEKEERFGKRIRKKPTCSFRHTCTDPSAPMPDPYATLATGPGRHNEYFMDAGPGDPDYTREWPISGLLGKKPKPEFADFVYEKLNCPVCSRKVQGCDNPVSTQFGKPKKFCKEHIDLEGYPAELMGRLGGEGLPDQPDPSKDYREVEAKWRKVRAKHIQVGDRVKLRKQVGTVLEVDPEMEDRTHRVEWDDPKAEALRITWVDPETLDLVY